jgi:hypothetical protein
MLRLPLPLIDLPDAGSHLVPLLSCHAAFLSRCFLVTLLVNDL